MRIKSILSGTGATVPLILGAALLAGCQGPTRPVVEKGEAAYQAIAVDPALASQDARPLAPGDLININVFEEPSLSVSEIVVDNAGALNLPLIGEVRAAGLTPTELARNVEAAYAAGFLRDPSVSVQVKKATGVPTIAVEGEVDSPGVFPYQSGQTLLTALALARSPTDTAALDEVMIFRRAGDQKLAGRFDIQAIRAGRMPDVELQPGDTVVVGLNAARGIFLDALRTLPIIGVWRAF